MAVRIRPIVVLLALLPSISIAFDTKSLARPRSKSSWQDASRLFSQQREALETQRREAQAQLERIDVLEDSIRGGKSALSGISQDIQNVEEHVDRFSAEILPPKGLSMEDYEAALAYYLQLPFAIRAGLCEALDMPDVVSDWTQTPEIVSRLYEERQTLTPKRLEDSLKSVSARLANQDDASTFSVSNPVPLDEAADKIVSQLFDGKSDEEIRRNNYVTQHLGRVTRQEGRSATARDLEILMNTLDASTFAPQGAPEAIPGGYIVRGQNKKSNGQDLIEALDSKLPAQWSAQVSLIPDFTEEGAGNFENEPILVLLNNDFSPSTSRWILSFSTAAACATAFIFGVGCFETNDIVAQRLQEMTGVGDYSGVSWLNERLVELLLPFVAIQGAHELGHLVVAWKEKIKTSPPTLLPFWVLPFMGAQTQIKSSPKNMSSLFDFAILGPFLGFVASAAFLLLGLQQTLVADAAALQYFPSLPVSVLQLSTLGGTIVDTAFGGAGMVTLQSASTNVPLHPFAIAGFGGIMISALDMLPLGSTDGGRISQALFGRPGHSIIGGATWFLLLVSTLFLDQSDILLGAWVVNNIAQNDMEVPCRDETERVDLVRSVAAFGMWFVAVLALTPMSS